MAAAPARLLDRDLMDQRDTINGMDEFTLPGQVAIVTGASRGIGAEIARRFAEAGADVALVARSADDLDTVAADVRERGRRALAVAGDVNDLAMLERLVEQTAAELGRIDVVVNNAGGSVSPPYLETRVEQLEASFHFNVSVPFELVRLAVPHLLAHGGGAVVNIGSVAGVKASRTSLIHSTTKAALAQLTRVTAEDLAPRIRVNAVLPGAVETDALRWYLSRMDPSVREEMIRRTPMRRNGTPRDIADAVLFLASPASSWITGKLLEVDGAAHDELIPKDTPDL
jgi:7-alpha-hydroxysteroid dehydrogenase